MLTGGSSGAGAVTVNTDDALMEDVLAVMISGPVVAAGMVIDVLKAPGAAVLKVNVVEPAITVPVVETFKPALRGQAG